VSRHTRPRTPIVGLLLLTAVAWLWVRSHSHGHVLAVLTSQGRVSGLLSSRGQVWLVMTNVPLGAERAWTVEAHPVSDADAEELRLLLVDRSEYQKAAGRFAWGRGTFQEVAGSWFFTAAVPHWFLVIVLAVPVVAWGRRRWVLWRRARQGLCLACGYDLRFSGDRCPECGWEREGACPAEVRNPA
jgi:hypothetical protein